MAWPFFILPLASMPAVAETSTASAEVFISASRALQIIEGGAAVLDARGDKEAPYLPSAVAVSWRDVRAGVLRDGRLVALDEARAHYEAKGVHLERPVLVYGSAAEGWGEEGRIWWDLTLLGHPNVFILDGGRAAWLARDLKTVPELDEPGPGDLAPARHRPTVRADHKRVRQLMSGEGVILDARTDDEFAGATPYFSSRGGHVPGARPLHWKRLLDEKGRLLPKEALRRHLRGAGISLDRPIVAYCTGGVRSAFVVAALAHLGIAAENYDGSWWDWSSRDELPVSRNDAP